MIGVWVLDYPPNRFIGSELMTHRLLKALQGNGELVKVCTVKGDEPFTFDGVPVTQELSGCDLLISHVGMPNVGWSQRIPRQVVICHNAEAETQLALHTRQFALVVCNSQVMCDGLAMRDDHNYLVVHPPAPVPSRLSAGECVTVVNLNVNKVGRFWDIAESLPGQRFLAVRGGYADQVIPDRVPANVEVIDHVPQDRMWDRVWSRTRLLLAPSERESWNMTAGEALAHGIRTVSTDLPGVRENLGDTATYLLRDDVPAWVSAVSSAPMPDGVAVERARLNRARYLSDVDQFVKAVATLGNNHSETAHYYH